MGISPAFQWSQSKDYILINVKFAHKLDTPATLGVKSKGADIKSTELVFEAASKSKNKRFKLSLQLARAIVPEESEWSMAAVGRATFSLKKTSRNSLGEIIKSVAIAATKYAY